MRKLCVLFAASALAWPGLSSARAAEPTLTVAPFCVAPDGQPTIGVSWFLTGAEPFTEVEEEIRFPFGADTGAFLTDAFGRSGEAPSARFGFLEPPEFVAVTMRLADGTVLSQTILRPCGPTVTNADCKSGGWQTFGVFKNQGDCVSYVATKGKNPPHTP
jgi:hypothetical protein